MRRNVSAAARPLLVLLAVALCAGCLGGGGGSSQTAAIGCPQKSRPATPLLIRLDQPPSGAEVCVGSVYLNVVMPAGWSGVPSLLAHATPGVHVWQERSLQYGFTPCRGCPAPALNPAQVERDHPEWILKDVSGADVHPPGHPSWVMYDISNVDYLDAWANAAVSDLQGEKFVGVVLVDAGNHPAWVFPPVDPSTGKELTVSDHAVQQAEAMATVRAGLKTNGFSMVAENGPPTVIDPGQIGSTDAVSVGRGFARLSGVRWDGLFHYFEAALDAKVGAWVWDGGRLDRTQRVFGLASYLLVSGLGASYAVAPDGDRDRYQLDPGLPTGDPVDDSGVWTRQFESGAVAVNPGPVDGVVDLPGANGVTVPAGGAVIDVGGTITSSAGAARS